MFGSPGDYPIPGSGAEATVSIGYDAAATSIVLTAGHGARFPAVPFYLTWYNFTDFPYSAPSGISIPQVTADPNQEIILVTGRSTDTLTVTRASSPQTHNTGGKTYKMRITGPIGLKLHQFQPSYDDVTDEHIYEDAGASYSTTNDEGPIIFLLEYRGNLLAADAAILDAHLAEAFKKVYPFSFTNPRTGVTHTGVHYLEWEEDHEKTWTNTRIVKLIKRPA